MTTGPIPRLGPGPVPGDRRKRPFSARRALLLGGSAVAALLVAAGGALAYTTLSDDETRPHHRAARPGPARTTTLPSPVRSKKPKPKPKPAAPVDIRDERTDPKPLTTSEVFPHHRLKIAGRTFILAKSVINDHCSLAANGPFADELTRQHCRRVVRATFVSADKKIAVTTGLAVMPTDAAASAALKIQDPAHYESFRGMRAKGAAEIDKAGGIAASGLRGRYIVYAYAMYADGHKAKADDKTLKAVAGGFRDSTAKPIEKRADDGRARD